MPPTLSTSKSLDQESMTNSHELFFDFREPILSRNSRKLLKQVYPFYKSMDPHLISNDNDTVALHCMSLVQ